MRKQKTATSSEMAATFRVGDTGIEPVTPAV
jgi:hypothetical protein